jgi:hypothetical protein
MTNPREAHEWILATFLLELLVSLLIPSKMIGANAGNRTPTSDFRDRPANRYITFAY